MYRTFCWTLALLTLAGMTGASANAQFSSLTRRVPSDANAILFMDVDRLLDSPLAKQEGWREDTQKAFEAGLILLPPNVSRFVASAHIDFDTMSVPSHTYAFDMSVEPDVAQIAARTGGTVDNIGGKPVAVLPGDYFVARFTSRSFVLGNPAQRQAVANYIRRVDNDSMRLSEYLEEAKGFAENNAPISMAVDLSHAVPRDVIRARLDASEALKGKNVDLDKLADAIASIRGLTFGVNVADVMTGSVKVDFAEDVSLLGDAAKPLLLEALSNRGLMIDEIENWDVQATGKSIRLIGKLEDSGLRRVLSLIPVPPPLQAAREQVAQQPDEAQQKQLVVTASQNYFKSVDSLIQDLQRDKRNRSTRGQTAAFFDRYADRIDRLPSVNVDPYLIDFGQYVSGSLRNGSGKVRTALVSGTVAAQNVPQAYDYSTWFEPIGVVGPSYWGGGGGVYGWSGWEATPNVRATMQEQSRVRFQQQVQGDMSANEIMAQIQTALGDTRRQMTQKFGVQF